MGDETVLYLARRIVGQILHTHALQSCLSLHRCHCYNANAPFFWHGQLFHKGESSNSVALWACEHLGPLALIGVHPTFDVGDDFGNKRHTELHHPYVLAEGTYDCRQWQSRGSLSDAPQKACSMQIMRTSIWRRLARCVCVCVWVSCMSAYKGIIWQEPRAADLLIRHDVFLLYSWLEAFALWTLRTCWDMRWWAELVRQWPGGIGGCRWGWDFGRGGGHGLCGRVELPWVGEGDDGILVYFYPWWNVSLFTWKCAMLDN